MRGTASERRCLNTSHTTHHTSHITHISITHHTLHITHHTHTNITHTNITHHSTAQHIKSHFNYACRMSHIASITHHLHPRFACSMSKYITSQISIRNSTKHFSPHSRYETRQTDHWKDTMVCVFLFVCVCIVV